MTPRAVADGLGWDSTAMLIGLRDRGIVPDLILHADTGGEKPETYAYHAVRQDWLERNGFPPMIVVRYEPRHDRYTTLEGNCLANETLPSPAFAFKRMNCSKKFKQKPQHYYIKKWQPAIDAWARGEKVIKFIGFDAGPRDRTRTFAKSDYPHLYDEQYPLIEWGWTREDCEQVIRKEGLPMPVKSSCFFCPAMKKCEIDDLMDNHPDLFDRAVAMEDLARDGKHGLKTIEGLGSTFSWRAYARMRRAQGRLFGA